MQKVAKFSKVSFEQFNEGWQEAFGQAVERDKYDALKLPTRATVGSAGYDFFSPLTFTFEPGETIKVPTGIRAEIAEGWVLMLFPRSGLGFKYRLQMNNTGINLIR